MMRMPARALQLALVAGVWALRAGAQPTCGVCPSAFDVLPHLCGVPGAFTARLTCSQTPGIVEPETECHNLFLHSQRPRLNGPYFVPVSAGAGAYVVRMYVDIEAPYNSATGANTTPNGKLDVWWNRGATATHPTIDLCENNVNDKTATYIQSGNYTCANLLLGPVNAGTFSVRANMMQGTAGNCCTPRTDLPGMEFIVRPSMLPGCLPLEDACTEGSGGADGAAGLSCQSCIPTGGGCGVGLKGSSALSCAPAADGPQAYLRYAAGGAGRVGAPGSTGANPWSATLGRYWSHDYAERIVRDPDENHVWLITRYATFREFRKSPGGSGLVPYPTSNNLPKDEYRQLFFDSVSGGFQLKSLDGSLAYFRSDGLWDKTVLPANPANPTQGNYSGSQLVSVSLPDGRSETYEYYAVGHPSVGKLFRINEVGVGGSPVRTWTYSWSGDDLTRIDRPDLTAWEFLYDATHAGYLLRVRLIASDLQGRIEAHFKYDALGNVVTTWRGDVADGSGNPGPAAVEITTFTYNNGGLMPTETRVNRPQTGGGQETVYKLQRDPLSTKVRVTEMSGDCPTCGGTPNDRFEYPAFSGSNPFFPTARIDARGTRTEFLYDAQGRRTSLRENVIAGTPFRTTNSTYSETNFPALPTLIAQPSTSGAGLRETAMDYDDTTGLLLWREVRGVETTYPAGSFTLRTEFTYNGSGQIATIDPPGYGTADQTQYLYPGGTDPRKGMLASGRVDPLIGTTTFGYDGFNRRISVVDPNGVETVTEYDALDRLQRVTHKGVVVADDLVTDNTFNTFGDLSRVTLPLLNVIEYGYEPGGLRRLVSVERKLNAVTPGERAVYTLDAFGRRTREELQRWDGSQWLAPESTTDYIFATRCHLDQVIRGAGSPTPSTTEYAYDCNNNLEKVWDANHPSAGQTATASQSYGYDALDRLTTMTQPFGGAGGGNAVTGYLYDVQDHLRQVTDAEGNVATYTTSDRDMVTQQVSPVSGTTAHAYNEHGALTSTTDARGITVTRIVDAIDRTTREEYPDPRLDTDFAFDGGPVGSFFKGRLRSITRNAETIVYDYDRFGRMLQDGTLLYQYDKNGNRTRTSYPSGVQADFTYDFADRQATLTAVGGGLVSTAIVTGAIYKPSGPLTTLTLGNGLTEQRLFDQRYFPSRITVPARIDWVYTVNAVGNPTQIADGGAPRVYGYQDFQYFLTQGDGPWGTRNWTYDKIGNRLTETRTGLTDTYSYLTNPAGGRSPKLQSIALAPSAGARIFRYDQVGGELLTSSPHQEKLRTYDDAGRLARIIESTTRATSQLRYDGRGFLAEAKQDIAACNPVGQRPTYSSDGWLMQRRQYSLFDVATPTAQDAVLYFAGRPLATVKTVPGPATVTFLTTDHLGTPILATSAATTALWVGGFEPFGTDWGGAQSANVFLRFPGQWSDLGWTGTEDLSYNVHRWYQPSTGRYERPDPLGLQGGTWRAPRQTYGYADGHPLVNIDPLGLAVVTSGCMPEQDRRIQTSAGQAEAAAKNCIKCDQRPWIEMIRNTIYHCVSAFEQERIPGYETACAQGSDQRGRVTGRDIVIFDGGFQNDSPDRCGCLQATILHEVGHLMGLGDPAAGDLARRCFSCANDPF